MMFSRNFALVKEKSGAWYRPLGVFWQTCWIFVSLSQNPKIATHAVARSRARDIGDSANDRLGNFDSVFTHHSRTLVSFSFRQHGVTIRRVRLGVA